MNAPVKAKSMGKRGRPSTGRDDVPMKVDRRAAVLAKAIANALGTVPAQVLTEAALPGLKRQYAKVMKELVEG